MASTASLLILLSIASPMLAISEEIPEVFPSKLAQDTHIQDGMSRLQRFSSEPTARPPVNVTFWAEEQPRACDLTEHLHVPKSPKSKVAKPEERRRPRASRFVQFVYVVFLLFYVDRQL
ncbi:hypothetical protein ACI65C_004252 [Semiaphis heraclei]